MSANFNDYFGNEHNGYDILYQNMKYGLIASKEFSDFLRERSNIEETNCKLLTKLAKQANGNCMQGTFAPFWSVLRGSAEKLSTLHQHMLQKVSELVKDVARYADDLHKKHKAVKDSESSTLEVVVLIQNTKQSVHKARDLYSAKSAELDKLRKENASVKDIEKAEAKLKKVHEEYKSLFEKYSFIRQEFEKKMSQTCKHFQDVEEAHLKQMKQFLNSYADLIQSNHDLIGQVHKDFKHQCLEMTVEKLLELFVHEKYAGLDKTSTMEITSLVTRPVSTNNSISEADQISTVSNGSQNQTNSIKPTKKEPSLASKTSRRTTSLLNLFTPNFQSKDEPSGSLDGTAPCSAPSSPSGGDPVPTKDDIGRHPLRESKWFQRSKRAGPKAKKSKKKKDDTTENANVTEDKSDLAEKDEDLSKDLDNINSPDVDEDGYCIRPKQRDDKGSVCTTTDSDSEEDREPKIHVEIKPLSNGVAPMSVSVDELVATAENLSLYPVGTTRRTSNTNNSKASGDLLGLNFSQSSITSNPTSPHGNLGMYAPLSGSVQSAAHLGSPLNNSADVGDVFSEIGEMNAGQATARTSTPTTSSIAVPRPPSRRSEGDFRTAGSSGSRGPSPLTIGMADTIPLAVAFHEIIHSYFRGTEESKCQVKMSGDMMLSFPTGIVGVLANNPTPAKLCFRLKNIHRLENVVPNKQLIGINTNLSSRDSTVLEFNMSALTSLLKRQSEKNPNASYFNVDILKYQIKPKLGAASCPFQLVAYWKCEQSHTDLKVDYKYNLHAMSAPSPLLNVSVCVPVNGGVQSVLAMPQCQWNGDTEQALWRFTELSQHSDERGVGSLRARLDLASGPSQRTTISSQFNCEGATLSGVEFELIGTGYRLSLVKRRFVSGKYICDSEVQ